MGSRALVASRPLDGTHPCRSLPSLPVGLCIVLHMAARTRTHARARTHAHARARTHTTARVSPALRCAAPRPLPLCRPCFRDSKKYVRSCIYGAFFSAPPPSHPLLVWARLHVRRPFASPNWQDISRAVKKQRQPVPQTIAAHHNTQQPFADGSSPPADGKQPCACPIISDLRRRNAGCLLSRVSPTCARVPVYLNLRWPAPLP